MAYNFIDYLLGRTPTREDKERGYFGDTISKFGNDELNIAQYLLENAGTVSADSLPDELGVLRNVISYPADLANAALFGAIGGGQKLYATAGEVFGGDSNNEKRLTRDLLGMAETAGISPQGRMLSLLAAPAKAAVLQRAPYLLSDAKYAARSIADADFDGVMEAFYGGGEAQDLSAASRRHNGGPALDDDLIVRDGSKIKKALDDEVDVVSFLSGEKQAPMSNVTNVKSLKDTALEDHVSVIRPTGELKDPEYLDIADAEGRDALAIVGDNSGRFDIMRINNYDFSDEPIRSYAGFQYIDVDDPSQGYAGARSATSSKFNQAKQSVDPLYVSAMMGEKSADFSMHEGYTYGRMVKSAILQGEIPEKNMDFIDSAIRNIGVPKTVKALDENGNPIKKADGSFKTKSVTTYPFRDFDTIRDPDALMNYILDMPVGTERSYFLKGLDKAGLYQRGMPKVHDARLAVADADQLGMDWGTTGYRAFTPDLERGIFDTTSEMSTTYDTGVGKVGPSYTLLPKGSRGIPANLFYTDLSEAQRAKGTGGGLLMNSADYKVLEMSPEKAKQPIRAQNVDIISTFLELEKNQGRRNALDFANTLLSEGKITNALLKQAKKRNAPQWVIAAIASKLALQKDEES